MREVAQTADFIFSRVKSFRPARSLLLCAMPGNGLIFEALRKNLREASVLLSLVTTGARCHPRLNFRKQIVINLSGPLKEQPPGRGRPRRQRFLVHQPHRAKASEYEGMMLSWWLAVAVWNSR
jgi:hypothetical protein